MRTVPRRRVRVLPRVLTRRCCREQDRGTAGFRVRGSRFGTATTAGFRVRGSGFGTATTAGFRLRCASPRQVGVPASLRFAVTSRGSGFRSMGILPMELTGETPVLRVTGETPVLQVTGETPVLRGRQPEACSLTPEACSPEPVAFRRFGLLSRAFMVRTSYVSPFPFPVPVRGTRIRDR